jgi:hypothetical protein
VKLRVTKSGTNATGCAAGAVAGAKAGLPQIRLSVTPRRVVRGKPRTFRFRVKAGRFAVSDARVRFAGRTIRTDTRGRARIRAALRRPGLRRAVAWKRTFRRGATHVRVLR